MIKIRGHIIFFCALALFTASAIAQRAQTPAAKDYFPLRVGDSWKYRLIDDTAEYTQKVLSAEKQADGSVRYLLERLAGVEIHDWYSKTAGWVLLHREAYPKQEGMEVKYEPARQYLKNPLVAGATWIWKGKNVSQADVTESSKVVGPEVVKVPAGTFRAMKIISHYSEADAAATTKTYWYAPGVGLVKWVSEGGKVSYGWELVDYSFKTPAAER